MADITLQNTPATLGDIANWNVGETTNPPTIGLPNPGTGGVNGSAVYGLESEFAIEKDATFRATPFPGSQIVGSIESVSVNGSAEMDVGVDWSMSSYFGGLSVDRVAPPVLNQPLGSILQTYIGLVYDSPVSVSSTRIPLPGFDSTLYSFPGWSGNVWAHICDLLAKLGAEIVYWPDASGQPALEVRPMSSVTLDTDDKTPPTLRYEVGSPGRRIDVVHQNQSVIFSALPNITNYSENPSLESNDSGWSSATPAGIPMLPQGGSYFDIAYGGGLFVAVGGNAITGDGYVATSPDGKSWATGTIPTGEYRSIAWNGSVFVAVGISSACATSFDGISWTAQSIEPGSYHAVVWAEGKFLATGGASGQGVITTSSDGVSWTTGVDTGVIGTDVAWGDNTFVVIGLRPNNARALSVSVDGGATWNSQSLSGSTAYSSIAWGNGTFVAVGETFGSQDGSTLTSPDGAIWTKHSTPSTRFRMIRWAGSSFIASGLYSSSNYGLTSTSVDGLLWVKTDLESPLGGSYRDGFATGGGTMLIIGNIGNVSPSVQISALSLDGGATWESGISEIYISESRENDEARAFAGDYSYRVRANIPSGAGIGASPRVVTSRFEMPTTGLEAVAGGIATIGVWTMIYNPTSTIYQSTGTGRLAVTFKNDSGDVVQSSLGNIISSSGFSTWSGVIPAAASSVECSLIWNYYVYSGAGANSRTDVRLHADAHFVVDGFGVPYFDGDSPNSAWNGTSNNSSSTQVNPNNIPLYDAFEDNNNVMSVESGEVARFIITSGVYPTSILRPVPVDTLPINVGNYHVIDSTGLPIVAEQWLDYGGDVNVTVGDGVGEIIVTITAPIVDIPSTTGPYRLASSDGDSEYATLMVAGTGIITDPRTLNLLTGADRNKVTQELAATINSPFIDTIDDAYTVGTALSAYSNGYYPVIDFVIPTSTLGGVGLGPGSTFVTRDCKYRVSSVNWDNLSCRGTAIRYSTIADYEAAIGARTIGDHDALWGAYTIRDFEIKSHKTV